MKTNTTPDLKKVACCRAMYEDLLDNEVVYDFIYNRLYYPNRRIFAYCPNCGTKLPDYSEEYCDALEEAVGKEFCDIKEEEIPEEFKSDEWWKKRNITGKGSCWNDYDPIRTKNYDEWWKKRGL
jgi:hypothetical protein